MQKPRWEGPGDATTFEVVTAWCARHEYMRRQKHRWKYYSIKRVPIVEKCGLVGVVSCADLSAGHVLVPGELCKIAIITLRFASNSCSSSTRPRKPGTSRLVVRHAGLRRKWTCGVLRPATPSKKPFAGGGKRRRAFGLVNDYEVFATASKSLSRGSTIPCRTY